MQQTETYKHLFGPIISSASQWQVKNINSVKMDKWDITLLSLIFIDRKSYFHDDGLFVYINEIRDVRNKVCHTDATYNDEDFNGLWQKTKHALIGLGMSQKDLHEICTNFKVKVDYRGQSTATNNEVVAIMDLAAEKLEGSELKASIGLNTSALAVEGVDDLELANIYYSRAFAYFLLETVDDNWRALADANKSVQLDPSFSKGYALLGSIYQKLLAFEQSISYYEIALSCDPGNDDLQSCLKKVQSERILSDSIRLFDDKTRHMPMKNRVRVFQTQSLNQSIN